MLRRCLLCAALAALVFAPGCAKPQPPGKQKLRIALVMKSLANEFFKTMEDGARAHQKEHADTYELTATGIKDERDVSRQIEIVQQMIARQVDAIIIAPADSKLLVAVCKQAMDKGIVVVNIDNKLDAGVLAENDVNIPFVGPDNRKGARLAGECLAKKLKPGDKVAIVEGIPNAMNGVLRKQGFQDAMDAAKIAVATSQSAYWETDKAERLVSGMINQHEDLKAVLCANDSMALGAIAALRAAGKLGDVMVVGYDNISPAQTHVKEGRMLCTVDQHGGKIAAFGIDHALKIIREGIAPADKETPVDLITAAELK